MILFYVRFFMVVRFVNDACFLVGVEEVLGVVGEVGFNFGDVAISCRSQKRRQESEE